jgi:hypothetical protein
MRRERPDHSAGAETAGGAVVRHAVAPIVAAIAFPMLIIDRTAIIVLNDRQPLQ